VDIVQACVGQEGTAQGMEILCLCISGVAGLGGVTNKAKIMQASKGLGGGEVQ
jgi:hypothetical protein